MLPLEKSRPLDVPNGHYGHASTPSIAHRLLPSTKRWKVLRKRILKCWFGLPKSSFGEHNIARMGLQNTTNMRDAWCSSDVFFVTILQGWVYKTQPTCERCMRAIRRFLCNNIARMGLQNTTNMRDASWSSDVFFVTILQGWVYKTQQTREMHWWSSDWYFLCNITARMGLQRTTNMRDACEQSDAVFVTILQGWVYKTLPTYERCIQTRARCMRAIRRFLCNNNATMGLQNTTNMREMHWWSSDVFFVTSLKGWVYKAQQTREMHDRSSDVFFVATLQGCSVASKNCAIPAPYLTTPKSMREYLRLGKFARLNVIVQNFPNASTHVCSSSSLSRGLESRNFCSPHGTIMRNAWWSIVWCFLCSNIARMGLQNTTQQCGEQKIALLATRQPSWTNTPQPFEMHHGSPDVFFVWV